MKWKLIVVLGLITCSVSAKLADDGDVYFNNKQYAKARTVYENLLKQRPGDVTYRFRYARCCYEMKDFDEAMKNFSMLSSRYPQRDLYLAEANYQTYHFDEAVSLYQSFIGSLKADDANLSDYQAKQKQAEMAARMFTKIDDIAIIDSVQVSKQDFLKYYKYSQELGTLKQEIIKMGRKSQDRIRFTTQRGDRRIYSDSIHGQMNLFGSYKLLDTWSEVAPVSDVINTKANENYPFLLLDGVTVYFAADGENSLGGYDIFVTRFTPSANSYLAPENIGFPFNSPANDYMMVIDEQRQIGWFASDRNQPAGKVIIYTFVPNRIKNMARSEDKEYLRNLAQLKVFRKGVASAQIQKTVLVAPKKEISKREEFVVNDSVVYSNADQFHTEDIRKAFVEYQELKRVGDKMKTELDLKRATYATTETESDKKQLTEAIADMEQRLIRILQQIAEKETYVRNAENKALMGN